MNSKGRPIGRPFLLNGYVTIANPAQHFFWKNNFLILQKKCIFAKI